MFIQHKNRVTKGLKNCTYISTFKLGESFFFVSVYVKELNNTFSYNPLNRANLMTCFNTLAIPPKIPTRMGGTRWLPHTRLAIKNILHGYDAIVQHLQQVIVNIK
jgi:hypothetical protein